MNQLLLVSTQLTTLIHGCFTGSSAFGSADHFNPKERPDSALSPPSGSTSGAVAGPIPAGSSLCGGFHYVFSGGAAQPSMMLQPPPLTSAQERCLVAQRQDERSSCENTAGARSSREKEKRC